MIVEDVGRIVSSASRTPMHEYGQLVAGHDRNHLEHASPIAGRWLRRFQWLASTWVEVRFLSNVPANSDATQLSLSQAYEENGCPDISVGKKLCIPGNSRQLQLHRPQLLPNGHLTISMAYLHIRLKLAAVPKSQMKEIWRHAVFMDFEASAARGGFPVEVGWAWVEGTSVLTEALLIAPADEWLTPAFTWDPIAEGIHGLFSIIYIIRYMSID